MGVVFGDLGTRPLYALQEAFHGASGVTPSAGNVIGCLSLFRWSLILLGLFALRSMGSGRVGRARLELRSAS